MMSHKWARMMYPRMLAKRPIIEEILRRAGVDIEYVLATYQDNPEGNLSKQIKTAISEYERLRNNERMARGERLTARGGSIVARGHALYGYDLCNRGALQRLLDPHLSGEFQRGMLIDKKAKMEEAITELEREWGGMITQICAQSISREQEDTLIEFARQVADGLDCADSEFGTRRGIVEAWGVEASLYQEQGQKT